MIWTLLLWIGQLIVSIVLAIPGWALSLAANILAIVVPVCALAILILIGGAAFWLVMRAIAALASEINKLGAKIAEQSGQAAADAGYIAILAAGAAAIAYMGTNDFLEMEKFVTLKFLTIATIVCCIGKMDLMIPGRVAKMTGLIILAISLSDVSWFIYFHRPSINLDDLSELDPKLFVLCFVIAIMTFAVLYPFTPRGWKRLLSS